ncbi:porin [Paraburkholderia sp.]|uniref:porin n=1 Tax=Paraburkholderia sp. TaxID=1926495 RepID=UPI0039E31938
MKKVLMALACTATTGMAHAQSSVTIYGFADEGLQYTSNQAGSSAWAMAQGALGTSKWGITGKEDLGGGMRAVFKLESAFNMSNGAALPTGYIFGNQAYVGLGSDRYGELRLGRQYDLNCDSLLPFTSMGKFAGVQGAHAGDVDNLWADFKLSNLAKYLSPDLWGFHLGAAYGFGNTAGSMGENQVVNFSLTYANGPFSAAGAFMRVNNPATAVWGGTAPPAAGGAYVNPLNSPIYRGYASASSMQVAGGALQYQVGSSTFGAVFTNAMYNNAVQTTTTPLGGSAHFNTLEGNYIWNVTPAFLLGAAYSYTWATNARYRQLNLGTTYALSKRTLLYLNGVWQHASGTNSLGMPAVAANLDSPIASDSRNQTVVRVGIRQAF